MENVLDQNQIEAEAPNSEEQKGKKKPKQKVFAKGMGKLLSYMSKYWLPVLIATLFTVAAAVFAVLAPAVMMDLTDEIITAVGLYEFGIAPSIMIDMGAIVGFATILIIFYVAGQLLDYVQTLIMVHVNNRVAMDLRTKISQKINKVPLKYYDKNTVGDVLSRTTNDVDRIGEVLSWNFTPLISNIAIAIGTLIAMFYHSWQLALVGLATVPVAMIIVGLVVAFSQKFFKRQADLLGDLNGIVEENFSGQSVVKAFNGQKKACEDFNKINNKHFKASFGAQFFQGIMFPAIMFVAMLGFIAVSVVGGVLYMQGTIASVGVIIAFTMYVRLFQQSIGSIGEGIAGLQAAAAASVRVFEFLEEEEQPDESHKDVTLIPSQVKGQVEFRNVKFGYLPDKTIIHDFSAVIKPGQKVAIVGPTGAGKTTMVNLLMKFYELDGGQIFIDGVDTAEMKREDVRALFGMVLQDSWLFEGSIRDNIIYSLEDVSQRQVGEAAKAAGVDHFIKTFPDGYNTVLSDEVNISGGQKQLLTIARAMIQNSPMLILDEATSNVDTRTERQIQEAMDKLSKGRTSFVIAHRLSTIKNADLILVMRDGDIVEKGSHDELLEKGGFYSELYKSQFTDNIIVEESEINEENK
ncbi:MAG: ABC transporter ATP-binding protein/permease [Firmicutes bacterium]|nr:ABC transporter ATP-binding protein/permease [Bacillota bacterium]